jgi:hypothetical protein
MEIQTLKSLSQARTQGRFIFAQAQYVIKAAGRVLSNSPARHVIRILFLLLIIPLIHVAAQTSAGLRGRVRQPRNEPTLYGRA